MQDKRDLTIKELAKDCHTIEDVHVMLKDLFRDSIANGLEEQIIALYAKGMSTRDIEEHMKDLYGIEVSAAMVSKVTDKIMPMVADWQCRPLDRVYPIVFLDAIHFKVRQDNRIINKAAYNVLGIQRREASLKKVYQALTLEEA